MPDIDVAFLGYYTAVAMAMKPARDLMRHRKLVHCCFGRPYVNLLPRSCTS
jgi:hypothetical protein